MERWLAVSDIHDDVAALRSAVDFAAAQRMQRIVVLGDLSLRPYRKEDLEALTHSARGPDDIRAFVEAKRRHNGQLLEEMASILNHSGMPYQVIPGNYDGCLAPQFGDHDLHGKSLRIGEAKVAGFGGGNANPPHIELLRRIGETMNFDDDELLAFLQREQPTVALIHNPPFAFCDDLYNGKHAGTPASALYLRQYRSRTVPLRLVLSGHIHEAGPNGNNPNGVRGVAVDSASGTVVLNPGNLGRFEMIDPHSLQTVRPFDYGTFIEVRVEADGRPVCAISYTVQPQNREDRSIGQVRRLQEIRFEYR